MIRIDGSMGEGGGQILRSSLALSCLTGTPVTLVGIRAGRQKPGLLRQHLCGVRAATEISDATVSGDTLGSRELVFRPGPVRGGRYRWAVGSAGSAGLVLQTVMPPLWVAAERSELQVTGGTHNPSSPPAEFLRETFLPLVCAMGPKIELTLTRHGFYPAGGGIYDATIEPARHLVPMELLTRGAARLSVHAKVANLRRHVGFREVQAASAVLDLDATQQRVEKVDSAGPGNAVVVRAEASPITEVFTGFGRKGVSAEQVGRDVAREVAAWLQHDAPVGEHLADQLLIPMAMARGGRFRTGRLSAHTRTNLAIVQRFLDVRFDTHDQADGTVIVAVA